MRIAGEGPGYCLFVHRIPHNLVAKVRFMCTGTILSNIAGLSNHHKNRPEIYVLNKSMKSAEF